MTSLYQCCMRQQVVTTITPKKKLVKRWFYIDIEMALQADADREAAIFAVPEDRKVRVNFGKDIKLDLSTPELEIQHLMFPLYQTMKPDTWMQKFFEYWMAKNDTTKLAVWFQFKNDVLGNIEGPSSFSVESNNHNG